MQLLSVISITQGNVTLSGSEAEYAIADEVAKEVLFVRGILKFTQPDAEEKSPTVFEDYQGAIQPANNLLSSGRSRHIDVRHRFLSELASDGKIRFEYIRSEEQHADIMTLALPGSSIEYHSDFIMDIK